MHPIRRLLAVLALVSPGALAQSLTIQPPEPTPLDVVRLHYHVGGTCSDPNSLRVTQQANHISVSVDRTFLADCDTVPGFFEEATLGRLPAGDYDAQLAVNPPPGTLGPTLLVGTVRFTVAGLPPTNALLPHEDYSDLWWTPAESGWALLVKQSGSRLFAVWVTYDTAGRPTWYSLQPGNWRRDSANALLYTGTVYRTTGPYWASPFDPSAVAITAVGTADFRPSVMGRAVFTYTIDGVTGTKNLQRMQF